MTDYPSTHYLRALPAKFRFSYFSSPASMA